MESDGTPWRPLVHAARHLRVRSRCVLEAPRERVHGQILNVGAPEANYPVREIAEIVGRVFPGCEVTIGERGADSRSYRVSFAKIHEAAARLPAATGTPSRARGSCSTSSRASASTHDDFVSRRFTRLKQIEHLAGDRPDRRVLPLDARRRRPTGAACTVTPADGENLVDVGIPTYGEPAFLAEAIESVLAQTFAGVAADDLGERPRERRPSPRAVEPYLADPRVRYVDDGHEPRRRAATRPS